MRQRAHDGGEHAGDGQRDGEEIERHGEGEVQLDGAHHAVRKRQQMRKFLHLVVHERDVGGVYGDVAAHAAHSDAYVGALERGRVVYAVADHADGQAALLIGFDAAELILWQPARAHFFNAEFRRDGVRGVGRVACQQHGRHVEG